MKKILLLLLILLPIQAISQNYSATWERIYPKDAPIKRDSYAMTNIGLNKVLLFGGHNLDTQSPYSFNDTWIFDMLDTSWTKLETKFSPSERFGHDIIRIDSNNIFLFGGVSNERENFQRDVWLFDITQKKWNQILIDSILSPPQMIWWPMCKLNNDSILIYGYDSNCCGYYFYYSISKNQWFRDFKYHYLEPFSGNKFVDLNENYILAFSGFTQNGGRKNDTWKMNKNNKDWEKIKTLNSPAKLSDYAMCKINSNFAFLYAGFGGDDTCDYDKLWLFDYEASNWFDITPEYRPKGRAWHSMSQLNDSTFLLFSGSAFCMSSSNTENDTWLLHFKKIQTEVFEYEYIVQNINFKDTKEELIIENLNLKNEVQVYNLLGILQNTFKVSSNRLKLNKTDFEKGIYFIQVNSNGNFTNYKFVGQK